MANMIKTNIRLKKVHQRLLKTVYPSCPIQRKIIKNIEKVNQIQKYSDSIWEDMYKAGYNPGVSNSDPVFYAQFD